MDKIRTADSGLFSAESSLVVSRGVRNNLARARSRGVVDPAVPSYCTAPTQRVASTTRSSATAIDASTASRGGR